MSDGKNQELNEEEKDNLGDTSDKKEESSNKEKDDSKENIKETKKEEKAKKKEDKIKAKNKKSKLEEEIDCLKDKLVRQMAEFENFRKRSEAEKSAMYQMGTKDIIEKILPVVDNLERGLASIGDDEKESQVAKGFEMIYKQFLTIFEEIGVEPIKAVGEEFNPDFHNAVMHEENPDEGENVVIEELQKGYTYKGAVIRYSMVKVVN